MIFENFKGKNYLNNLNFCAKNRDFDLKQNFQKLKLILMPFLGAKIQTLIENHNKLLIFGKKIQIHNFVIVLKSDFLEII